MSSSALRLAKIKNVFREEGTVMAPSAMVLLIRVAFSFSLCLGGGKAQYHTHIQGEVGRTQEGRERDKNRYRERSSAEWNGKVESVSGKEREGERGEQEEDGGAREQEGCQVEWVWQRISALKSTLSRMKAYYNPDISHARSPPCAYELVCQKFHFYSCMCGREYL